MIWQCWSCTLSTCGFLIPVTFSMYILFYDFSLIILIRRSHLQFPAFAKLDFRSTTDTGLEGTSSTHFWFVKCFFYNVMAPGVDQFKFII
jgi:hypothetical protein